MDTLLISEATARLEKGMYAQQCQPLMVAEAKGRFERAKGWSQTSAPACKQKVYVPQKTEHRQKLSLGHGPRREEAAKLIRTAALAGKLKVYDQTHNVVPPEILALIIPVRSALPDHPTRTYCPPRGSPIDRDYLMRLSRGAIVLSKSEFELWYRTKKAKREWPSQEQSKKQRVKAGRPRTAPMWRERIIECVDEGKWEAKKSIVVLKMLLLMSPTDEELPSDDTLARIVDDLFVKIGDDKYRRDKRRLARASRKIPNFSKKS